MAFEFHPYFQAPVDPNSIIWRYMDISKLLSLLERSALYFPRADKLTVADPYEGYYTKANAQYAKITYKDAPVELLKQLNIHDEEVFDALMHSIRAGGSIARATRVVSFVNSWHVLNYESAAMWTQYLRSEDGIAVQSTYQRLINSFVKFDDYRIYVGLMRYIDYDQEAIPLGQVMAPLMHKRKSFEHEHELRALIWTLQDGKNNMPTDKDPSSNKYHDVHGLYVNVDLNVLVMKVYVAPTAANWIVELITAIFKRYGLDIEIVRSKLSESPIY